ncbi:MAG: DNA mismatch repair protein MutS [Peptococcaceae bacterium]|nr:DNA mismatch repair protein MutS [Peptococcaceae bacterium]
MSYTPMINQYLEIKRQHKDAILFFRLGDFYEMFFDDAVTASSVLEITLTGRDAGQPERVPMCGVPYHAAETYIARLIQKGYKVAICEQVEDPSQARGIVKREVIRVVTPGTVLEGSSLDEKSHNYLVSVLPGDGGYGLSVADISTGLFQCAQFTDPGGMAMLMDELARLDPAEVIVPGSVSGHELEKEMRNHNITNITYYGDEYFTWEKSARKLTAVLGSGWRDTLRDCPLAAAASGSLLWYLQDTQKKDAGQIKSIELYSSSQFMLIDRSTRRNLEITASLRDGGRWGTLIWVLDRTRTAMGGRLIRTWAGQPLTDPDRINGRLDGVEELRGNIILRQDLKKMLDQVYDLERLASKAAYGTANARDLIALRNSLRVIPLLKKRMEGVKSAILAEAAGKMDPLTDLCDLLERSIAEEPPATVRDGGIIRDGYSPEVDRLRKVQTEGKSWLARLEAEERENTGIKSLKIGYNKVFGYYLEVTRANFNLVPEYFIRKQTLANAERYITPKLKELEEMILTAWDRLAQLEYSIFSEIREKVSGAVDRIQKTSGAVALVDVILSLAEVAVEENYNRPRISRDKEIFIKEGRHPVVEKVIGSGNFVPNDTFLDARNNVMILTGPNMAGKSTYMRQVALLVILAQMGSFIPAGEAQIGIVDRIFTRIGAADDLAGGLSTFMVEMMECRNIVCGATEKSLVLMDEVGRGTSTFDGISIARALVEHIVTNIGSRTLFSTHYHELTDLDALPGVSNYTIAVKDQDQTIIFLRKVLPGKADRSYGIHVAALAGLPAGVVERAREILAGLESMKNGVAEAAAAIGGGTRPANAENAGSRGDIIVSELRRIDISNITPLAALNILAKLQSMI